MYSVIEIIHPISILHYHVYKILLKLTVYVLMYTNIYPKVAQKLNLAKNKDFTF